MQVKKERNKRKRKKSLIKKRKKSKTEKRTEKLRNLHKLRKLRIPAKSEKYFFLVETFSRDSREEFFIVKILLAVASHFKFNGFFSH